MAFSLTVTFGTGATMAVFRKEYIRDFVDESVTPPVYLSRYNQATAAEWITDAAINSIVARVAYDHSREVESVYDGTYYDRIADGETTANAATRGSEGALDALMRLVRGEIWRAQMADSGFIASMDDAARSAQLFSSMRDQMAEDALFIRARGSAPHSGPRLVRR